MSETTEAPPTELRSSVCPACGVSVPVSATGALSYHIKGSLLAGVTCPGSGVTVKGEHQ